MSDTAACGHRQGALQHHGRVARHPRGPEKGDALVLRTVVTELRGYSGKRDAVSEGERVPGYSPGNARNRRSKCKNQKRQREEEEAGGGGFSMVSQSGRHQQEVLLRPPPQRDGGRAQASTHPPS